MRRLVAMALLLLAACAGTGERRLAAHDSRLYRDLGERAGIEAIVDDLLEYIVYDERINRYFAYTDLQRFRGKLIEQICVEAGGPCTYTGAPMAVVHAGRGIDEAAFNALVEDLIAAMTANDVPVRAQNRLLKRLAPLHGEIVEPQERGR